MKIIVLNDGARVLYAGDDLTLSELEAAGADWRDLNTTTDNATLFEDVALPYDYVPAAWSYLNGEWAIADRSAYDAWQAAHVPDPAELIKAYDLVVQTRLDAVARDEFRYGDPNRPEVSPILHAISYAEEPAVPKFQAEGRALRAWRSLTWAAAASILIAVQRGERTVPSAAALLAELEAVAPAPTVETVVE